MPVAYCMIRPQPHYRRDSFATGLGRCGFEVQFTPPVNSGPGDVLVIWNRYGMYEQAADVHERRGGITLVAENGYLGRDKNGIQLYALAVGGHNGSGRWAEGDGSRFAALGFEPKPWRPDGGYVYIRGQRGIGTKQMASPPQWHQKAAERLKKAGHKVVVVEHPGVPSNDPRSVQDLQKAFQGASACYIWASSTGVRALLEGIPVFYDAPHWICATGAARGFGPDPVRDDTLRLKALERMAWAQWSIAEIASGEPFKRLCDS